MDNGIHLDRWPTMGKVVFAHDSRFQRKRREVYALGPFSTDVWRRYLEYSQRLVVVARNLVEEDGLADNLSSMRGVEFELCESISGIRARTRNVGIVRKKIRTIVKDADSVIARLPSEIGLLAIREAKRQRKAWAVEMAGCPWDVLWNYGTVQGKLYAPVMMARTRLAVAEAPFVLYVTRGFLQRRYPNRRGITVSCSDVSIEKGTEDVIVAREARIERAVKEPVILGLIGTLHTRYKGIQTVFEGLSKVRNRLPAVRFHILGAGNAEPWRREADAYGVGDLVHFDGTLPTGSAVLKWLDGIDLYLQPSLQEGLPRALIEAMSRGCPALGSRCAGIPELLPDNCLIKPGDAAGLGELLIRRVPDKQWLREQARSNWETSKDYSAENLTERRNEFWQRFAQYVTSQPPR